MQIFVRTPTNKTITLRVHSSDSIEHVKTKIEAKTQVPPNQQSLRYCLKQFEDGFRLNDYYINNYSTIEMRLERPQGTSKDKHCTCTNTLPKHFDKNI